MLLQQVQRQSPGRMAWVGCRPTSATSPPAPTSTACSGLGSLHWLHCSLHWKLRLEQEGHIQSPAGGQEGNEGLGRQEAGAGGWW
jgi:hypothetical protein